MKQAETASNKLILHLFYQSFNYHLSFIYCQCLATLKISRKIMSMSQGKHLSTFSNAQQIKLMAQVLSKMAKFFNDMAEQCLVHLAGPQAIKQKQRTNLNKQSLRQFQNSKLIDQLDLQTKDTTYKSLKKDLVLKKIKSHKPKHPVSSFFIFYKDRGQAIAKTRGEVLGSKIAKVVGQLWKNMSQSEKQPYEAQARVSRQKYQQQMIQYKIKYTDELARLKQLKRQARIIRKYQQDKKQADKLVTKEKPQKDSQILDQLRDKEITSQIEPHENGSSSDDSDLDLEDDLSNSLSQINDVFEREQVAEDLSLVKQVNQTLQPKQFEQLPVQIDYKNKQNNSSSEQIVNQLQSSSREYHEGDLNVPIQSLMIAENLQPQQIQLLDKNQLQTLQKQLKDANLIQDQISQQILVKNPDQLCSIADSNLKSDIKDPPQQFVKPKGPVSSFFLFYRQKGKWISETRGLPLGPKAIKVASQIWKNLSESEKNVYIQQAKQTRQKYYKDKQQLKKKYGQDIFQKTRTPKSNKNKQKK